MKSNRLKDLIKTQNSKISFEEYRIRYATERFLLRLQDSEYKDNVVIKGGFLLGTIFKIEQRTTKDLDTSLRDIEVDRKNITEMLETISDIDLNDNVKFELLKLVDSQQNHVYAGFRAKLKMNFSDENSNICFDLDLGVGDKITPSAQITEIPLLFNEKNEKQETLAIYAYPLETTLAEKAEIVLDLGVKNSRMKDFYDIHLILNSPNETSSVKLYEAFENTWNFRHKDKIIDEELFEDWFFIIDEISSSKEINGKYWKNYTLDREYTQSLEFSDIMHQFKEYLTELHNVYRKITQRKI
ncbi:nucleotidyl transferase AbiEii/AbiGii toxin family protein [Xylocopilactobacillus apicola]|uniref:Abortive infection protein n=1 Tax=Xylocopilactobacillus apicola TaxID=2932184 RepID=A0AAU9DVW0_9LACO|nr:nucleotidyl transferase AbiEii/AbiGii toxin family protein [Xylocopilactobacillus apicola]BDR58053.1 abortive infection protein [Xylocopilactobacillus apicola]